MKIKIFLLGTVILSALIWFVYHYYKEYESIHIAFAGPMSGDGAAAGRLMTQAIQLYLKKINQKGGVNGRRIVLDTFDDQNDAKIAHQEAKKIVEKNRAVAVIGHWYSSASISAGKVYEKNEIPAITPGSAAIKVTEGNKWYFRNIYNAKASGQFLANYVKSVFKETHVSIIREEADYGKYLAQVFKQASFKLGMTVQNQWHYDNNADNLNEIFEKIVNELKSKKRKAGVIFLAVKATEGIKLVKLIKDAGISNKIIGASSLSEETFRHGFDNFPMEKKHQGFYTNDIYAATPLIFDTANENAQKFKVEYQAKHDEAPDWSAAYAYDTAMVLVEAIKKARIKGTRKTLQEDRKKIRETLASFNNIYEAVEGVTGFNYFDSNRDAQKPVSLGVYKNKNLVSALTQFQVMRNPNEIADFQHAQQEGRVLRINDKNMYKTKVVYVGIKMIEISKIDIKNLQFTLDFKLWFRFQGNFNPADIEFVNAVKPSEIKQQLSKPIIPEKIKDKITYHVYKIKSRFQADFLNSYYYKQHTIGISFRHRMLTRNNLIYVTDILGMGLTQEKSWGEILIKGRVLSPAEGWMINRALSPFSYITREYSAGDPDYLNAPEGRIEFSQLNAAIQIKKDQFTLRGTIPYEYAYHLVLLSSILFLSLTFFVRSRRTLHKFIIWLFQVIFAFLLLLSGEIIFAEWLAENFTTQQMKYIIKIFDILWWLIPAFLINVASERFIWTPLEERVGTIPNIIRHFFALLIYFIALIGIIVFVYEQRFTSLLAASGMIAMIVGLAIQINISNVFSGIMINMEHPFRIGDWVKIGQFDEGKIIDINWRATRIQARNGCIVSIPNSIAAESPILNFCLPDEVYWLWPTVYVPPRHHPERVKKVLLDALLSTEKILKEPLPAVIFTGINEWAATYWIAFCADDYTDKFLILEEVWTRVWIHLNCADITPAVMRQESYIFKGEKDTEFPSVKGSKSFGPERNTFRQKPGNTTTYFDKKLGGLIN
ncbi:ABC transporter substrate-binding protein [Candidatus Parabeggiatoa sp. HSG14]|uniref:ABC transporter substrate-binding protein n=1 Tax=Candidatus Parabeggiatoa sp. HSG14 TaxID=3055593 RepID=UPI0025A6B172|nr:ABC transporter substrate-binding protein [Thiotrichales bacterium HSG14]